MEEESEYHAHFTTGAARKILLLWFQTELKKQSLINRYRAKHCIKLDYEKSKDKEYMVVLK